MGRPLRIEYAGALYHITSRGNERKRIFVDEEDRKKFLEILEDYHDRYGILIHSYERGVRGQVSTYGKSAGVHDVLQRLGWVRVSGLHYTLLL